MAAGTRDFCLIQNCGHMFYGYDQLSFDMKGAMEECEFLMGHIIDRGGYFYLHDQCMLVNRRAWERLGKPTFGGVEKAKKTLPMPYRSIDNVGNKGYIGSVIVAEANNRYYEPAPGRNAMIGITAEFSY